MSAEWYYDDVSYVSVGYYTKDVSNWAFVKCDVLRANHRLLLHCSASGQGALVDEAKAAITAAGGDAENDAGAIRGWLETNRADNALVDTSGNAVAIFGDIANDPDIQWRITSPSNQADQIQTIDGIEFALQQEFGDDFFGVDLSGFGFITNYTVVDGDAEFDPLQVFTVPQFVLVGLSDSANLIGYYEAGGSQARVAYNWRDEFASGYGGGSVSITEEYDQLDMHLFL